MQKNRLEAFSDGMVAIIITIMVLELKVPHRVELAALKPLLPVFPARYRLGWDPRRQFLAELAASGLCFVNTFSAHHQTQEGEPEAGGDGVENQDEISALFCRCWCSVSYGWDEGWNSATQRVFVCRITAGLSLVLREIVTEEVLNGSVEFGCQVH
jgi:hypothetical protein